MKPGFAGDRHDSLDAARKMISRVRDHDAGGAPDTTYQARSGWPGSHQRFTAYGTPQPDAFEAAEFLRGPLQRAGAYHSDMVGLLADLAAGEVLVLDNGAVFQVVPQQPGAPVTQRELIVLRRICDGLIAATTQTSRGGRPAFHFTDIDGGRHSCGVAARAMWASGSFRLSGGELILTDVGKALLRQGWTPNMEDRYRCRYRWLNLPG